MSVVPAARRWLPAAARSVLAGLVLTALIGGAATASASTPAKGATPAPARPVPTVMLGSPTAKPAGVATNSVSSTYVVYSLSSGNTGRYCWYTGDPATVGPTAVSAAPYAKNTILTVVSTDLENRTNGGWVYCTTITNTAGVGTSFTIYIRSSL